MTPGTRVRMAEAHQHLLAFRGCQDHVDEFGTCVGVVEGLVDYGTQQGPEVNVRWLPSGLRYAYHPGELEVVE